jgi:membrane protein YdbS with pleckstrin-like domain
MQCKECGREAPVDSAFCPKCGAPFDDAEQDDDSRASQFLAAGRGRGNSPPEEDLWIGSYSPKAMAGPTMAAGVLTVLGMILASLGGPAGWAALVIALIVVWSGLVLVYLYRRLTVHYRLSTYRFFHEKGLLSLTGNRVEVIDIDDVTVEQGPIERMFGVGTISIQSSDTTDPELRLPGIENVRAVADLIDGTRRAERQRRGMFMENV